MAQKIDAAADHGIDAFIFDWYYYDDGLFLERAIEEGFFGAKNNERIKFSLMWPIMTGRIFIRSTLQR